MGLPGVGRQVRVVRQPERSEPVEAPAEPVREAPAVEPREGTLTTDAMAKSIAAQFGINPAYLSRP